MSFDDSLLGKRIEQLTDSELKECYYEILNRSKGQSRGENIAVYTTEIQKRENEKTYCRILEVLEIQREENNKTNRKMSKWTIAIGIMTAVMLIATIVNVLIAVLKNG